MNVTTVTIGRNYASTNAPMPQADWNTFRAQVRDALQSHSSGADRWAEEHTGTGTWNGVAEDSAKIALIGATFVDLVNLRKTLAVLRTMYGQDAIALSVGTSELV